MNADDSNTKCYRQPRSLLSIGLCCTALFVVFGVASTIAAYWNLDGSFARPERDAIVFGIFWSWFTLLGAVLIAYYFRYRLYVSESRIEQIGLFFTKMIDVYQVTGVRWRMIWRDVVLCAGRMRLRVELDSLSNRDRDEFISFLRQKFEPSIQQGWPLFSKRLEREREVARQREPLSWRRLSLCLILACLGTFAGFFLFVWFVGGGRQNLAVGVLLVMVLTFCLSLPATSHELRRIQSYPASITESKETAL